METKKIFLIKEPSQYEYLRERKITKGSRRPPTDKYLEKRLGNFYALVGYSEPVRVGVGWFEFTIY